MALVEPERRERALSLVFIGVSLAAAGALLRRREAAWALAPTLLYFTAIFCVFTHMGPVLQALVPMTTEAMSLTLMLSGLSAVAGWLTLCAGARRRTALSQA